MPRATFIAPIRSASFWANSSATEAATWKRLADVQASPMLRILAIIAPSTAASRSASSNTRKGALPPSSIETLSTCSADCSISVWPTSVEPVKDSLRVRGSAISGPIVLPLEAAVTTLSTPPGRPTSSRIPASASIDSGVSLAGLTTIVQPAAMAGPILRVPMAIGKFQGVIIRLGPIGWRMVSTRLAPLPATLYWPSMRSASPAFQRKNSAA